MAINKYSEAKNSSIYYDVSELSKLKYVKVIYRDNDDEMHEICTEVKFIGNKLISLYFKQSNSFYIKCPQDVILKFVTSDAMYISTAVLQDAKQNDNMVYFSILPPDKMVKQQKRKYSRINLDRSCVLVVNDRSGKSSTYLSKIVNLSASGVLITNLETMFEDKYVAVELSKYDCYHLVLFLEHDKVLKAFTRYVRHDCVDDSHMYAFHYMNLKPKTISEIDKYVASEQIKQLKAMQNN